jgi:hypothetical protein
MRMQLNEAWILIETREVEIHTSDGLPLKFRLELFEAKVEASRQSKFRFRVFRYDVFRVFPFEFIRDSAAMQSADHESLIVDPTFDSIDVVASTVFDAWLFLQQEMERRLGKV